MTSVKRQVKKAEKDLMDVERRIRIIAEELIKNLSDLKDSFLAIKSETLDEEVLRNRVRMLRDVIASADQAGGLPEDSEKTKTLAGLSKTLAQGLTVYGQQLSGGEIKTKTEALAKLEGIIKRFNSNLERL